jgi:hypothetical protein
MEHPTAVSATALDESHDALGPLIQPISTVRFFEHYFERELLHVARRDAGYFASMYGVASVEDALVLGANDLDRFALIKHDAPALTRENITSERRTFRSRSYGKAARSTLDPRSVLAAFADGYTLNIRDAGALHPPLARLCNRLQTDLGMFISVNAYLSPAQAQGFGIHYDTHDTLIVQIEGRKDWRIFAPVIPLPLETQPFSMSVHEGKLGAPHAIALAAGDSLYIPHGFPHEAATAEQRSLHLTFTISPLRVVDLLDSLIQLAARGDVELRRALPPGWHHDDTFAARLSTRLAELAPRAIEPQFMLGALGLAHNELFGATRTTAAGAFDALAALETLQLHSRIRLRAETPFELRENDDRLDIVLAAKVVSVPASARAAIARLAAGPAMFGEINAMLPAGTGLAFARVLVIEGLVQVEDQKFSG